MNTEKIRRWCDKDSTVIRMHIYVKQRECMQANTQIKFETTITDTHTLGPIFLLKTTHKYVACVTMILQQKDADIHTNKTLSMRNTLRLCQ